MVISKMTDNSKDVLPPSYNSAVNLPEVKADNTESDLWLSLVIENKIVQERIDDKISVEVSRPLIDTARTNPRSLIQKKTIYGITVGRKFIEIPYAEEFFNRK